MVPPQKNALLQPPGMLQIHCIPGVLYHNFCVWSFLYGFSMLYLFTGQLDKLKHILILVWFNPPFLDFYVKNYLRKRDAGGEGDKLKKGEWREFIGVILYIP